MATTKLLDPRTWFTTNAEPTIDSNLSVSTAVAPNNQTTILAQPEQGKDAEIVSGTFIPTIDATGSAQMEAHKHAARLRQTIETFNEDKQTVLEWVTVKFFTVLAYILPPFVAWIVGQAIGDAWGGKFDWNNAWSVYSHVISVSLEMMLPVMGYSVTVAVKRAATDLSD